MKIKTIAQIAVNEKEAELTSDLITARKELFEYKLEQKARDAKTRELLACATNELPSGDCHQTIYWINKALDLIEGVNSEK